jgi:hypothetical protein
VLRAAVGGRWWLTVLRSLVMYRAVRRVLVVERIGPSRNDMLGVVL